MVTIGLAGDVMLGRGVNTVISGRGYAYPWGNVLPLLKGTDVNIINLEAALTLSTQKVDKTFNFKATPDKVKTLTEADITLVNLANNHILDFSEEGLLETLRALQQAGIKYVGAGTDEAAAAKAEVLNVKETKIGVLGCTDNEPDWKAGPARSGINYIDISSAGDREKVLQAIKELSETADMVVVSIHWGPNMKEEPKTHFIEFAHAVIDQGAAIIHGHSAHNFQGIEVYKRRLILYDTGDFVDDYAVHPYFKNDHSFFFQVKASFGQLEYLQLIPVLISDCQVNLATGDAYRWCLQRMQELSARFGTRINDNGEVFLV